MSNIQQKISRTRPPRVQITYDLETDGAIIVKELKCVIGIIADLSSKDKEYKDRSFVFIDGDNFNDFLKKLAPEVTVPFTINGENQEYTFVFENMQDFNPRNIIEKIPALKVFFDEKLGLTDLNIKMLNSSKLFKKVQRYFKGEKVDAIFNDNEFTKNVDELKALFAHLEKVKLPDGTNLETLKDRDINDAINSRLEAIDSSFSASLDMILHNENFKKIESAWTGLAYLVHNLEFSERLALRVLNATKSELYNDLTNLEFDQSFLFQKLYEEEYGTYGGNPFTVLGIDSYIEKNADDFQFAGLVASIAAAAHIPTVVGAASSLFGLEDFTEINSIRDISKVFESSDMASFRGLRQSEDSKYLAIIMPRYMARVPYGAKYKRIAGVSYEETITSHKDFLWSNSIYVYIGRVAASFADHSWFNSIVGPENGGMVTDLPVFMQKSPYGDILIKCPTECAITDRREKELSQAGFITLCYCKDTDFASFFSGRSLYKPPLFDLPTANSNAALSARLQYMLNVSRFAHYLKCMMRDKIGTFASRQDIEAFLTRWIRRYVLLNEIASVDLKARYPLKEANLKVTEDENLPGSYKVTVFLRPHLLMEELTVSLRLVAKIPGGK